VPHIVDSEIFDTRITKRPYPDFQFFCFLENGSHLTPPFMAESSETKRNWEPKAPQDRIEESPAFQAGVTQNGNAQFQFF